MSLENHQKRIKKLFGHGDMSYHLAKLLEEAGELAQAVNKDASRGEIGNEIADVILSALAISAEYDFPIDYIVEGKLMEVEGNPKYQNFVPPKKLDK